VEFVETELFTTRIQKILSDEEYNLLQLILTQRPDAGNLIAGTKGLRKLRWSIPGKGKRGGARIIYYPYLTKARIYMAYIYKKSEQEDLTSDQLKILIEYVKKGVL